MQGNVTAVLEPDPANQPSGLLTTSYTYDVMEHLTQVVMPRSNATQTRTFTYDPTSHLLVSETHPETGTTTYSYSPAVPADQPASDLSADLVYRKTDASGVVTRYAYDNYDRVVTIYKYPYRCKHHMNTVGVTLKAL